MSIQISYWISDYSHYSSISETGHVGSLFSQWISWEWKVLSDFQNQVEKTFLDLSNLTEKNPFYSEELETYCLQLSQKNKKSEFELGPYWRLKLRCPGFITSNACTSRLTSLSIRQEWPQGAVINLCLFSAPSVKCQWGKYWQIWALSTYSLLEKEWKLSIYHHIPIHMRWNLLALPCP